VSVLPSVASLKALRLFARRDQGIKPMIGFGDPLFNPMPDSNGDKRAAARPGATKPAARGVTTAAYTDFRQGAIQAAMPARRRRPLSWQIVRRTRNIRMIRRAIAADGRANNRKNTMPIKPALQQAFESHQPLALE
jgi:hypothetical protein